MSYAEYHARDWAEGKTEREIRDEIARCEVHHTYQWNEVGSEHLKYKRIETLKSILAERDAAIARAVAQDADDASLEELEAAARILKDLEDQ